MANPSDPVSPPTAASSGNGSSGNGSSGGSRRPGATLDSPSGDSPTPPALGPQQRPGRPPGPSARPAAVVFGIIFVLFVVGFVADDLTSSHHPRPAARPPSTTPVAGTGGLVPEGAAGVLAPVVTADEPPPDILAAVAVPKGTALVPGSGTQQGVGLYDASVDVLVPASEQDVISFFHTELAAGRWQLLSSGASGDGYRIVAQHPGSDGNEWEIGVTTSPTTFNAAHPTMSVPPTGLTPVTLRLFATSDES